LLARLPPPAVTNPGQRVFCFIFKRRVYIMSNSNLIIKNIRVSGSVIQKPRHKRVKNTPASKRIRFYIGVTAPSAQSYALEVMAGRAPALSLEQYNARFNAPQTSVDKVTEWAKETGHDVIGYDPFLRLLEVEHDAASIRSIYGAKLSEYEDGEGGTFTGRSNGLHVPADVAHFISGVHRIDSRPHARTKIRIGKQISGPDMNGKRLVADKSGKNVFAGKGGKGGTVGNKAAQGKSWSPVDLAKHYGLHNTKGGAGTAAGFISLGGGLDLKVLAKANASYQLSAADWEFLFSDGAKNTPNADGSLNGADGENYLDAQIIQALAWKAKLLCSFATNTGVGIAHAYAALFQHASKPKQVSGSWGMAATNWDKQDIDLTEETLAAGQAMGVNIFNAAGDDGSNDNVNDGKSHDDYPASSKFNTACAGVFDDGKTVTAWGGVPNNGATGGGVSEVFTAYTAEQMLLSAAGMKLFVNADTGLPGRILGDVAGMADPRTGVKVMDGKGRVFAIGGTSAVSPWSCGANAGTAGDLGRALPSFNRTIYEAAAAGKSVCKIVTSGTNGAYTAKPGDAINFCGLGTVDYDALFNLLSQKTA
jgi:kumamolisin